MQMVQDSVSPVLNQEIVVVTAISDPVLENEINRVIAGWNSRAVISTLEDPALYDDTAIWVLDTAHMQSPRPGESAPVILLLDEYPLEANDRQNFFYVDCDQRGVAFEIQLKQALGSALAFQLRLHCKDLKENYQALALFLGELRTDLSRFYHDMNNPLSITTGNTQLLLEIASSEHLDKELIDALRDIDASNIQIKDYLQRIVLMKNSVASRILGVEGH